MTSILRLTLAITCLSWATPGHSALLPDTLKLTLTPALDGTAQRDTGQGYSVAADGNRIVVGAPFDDTGGTDSGVVRVYDATTGAVLHKIVHPNPAIVPLGSSFGTAVAISGTRLVVGSPNDNAGTLRSAGAVHVYDLAGPTPTQPSLTLTNPSPTQDADFGRAVAIASNHVVVAQWQSSLVRVYDLNGATPGVPAHNLQIASGSSAGAFATPAISGTRVAVGVPYGSNFVGYVAVFQLTNANPTTPLFTLTNPVPGASSAQGYFGRQVDLAANLLVVGHDTMSQAHVYQLTNSVAVSPTLTLTNPVIGSTGFGSTLAVWGSLVAMPAGQGTTNSVVQLFNLVSPMPAVPALTLTNPAPELREHFGSAVAGSGLRLVVGAPDITSVHSANPNPPPVGGAYVYQLNAPDPAVPALTLNATSPASGLRFGETVALSGTRLAVGSPGDPTRAPNAGSVSLYHLATANPTNPVVTLTSPGPRASNDLFGSKLALHGNRLAVFSRSHGPADYNFYEAIYLYDLTRLDLTSPVAYVTNTQPYGSTFVVLGEGRINSSAARTYLGLVQGGNYLKLFDVTATNEPPLVGTLTCGSIYTISAAAVSGRWAAVGVYGEPPDGRVYLFDLTGLSSNEVRSPSLVVTNPLPYAGDYSYFGVALALDENRLLVGARDGNSSYQGRAYAYDLGSATPTVPRWVFTNAPPDAASDFGRVTALSGHRALVGNPPKNRVFLYDLSDPAALVSIPALEWQSPDAYPGDFGSALAVEGAYVAVGQPSSTAGGAAAGAVQIYGPATNQAEVLVEHEGAFPLEGETVTLPTQVETARPGHQFTLRNTGSAPLLLHSARFSGGQAGNYASSAFSTNLVGINARASLTVTSAPSSGGVFATTLQISNSIPGDPVFSLNLSTLSLSFTADSDTDGLSDASEFQMSALGFDWQTPQTNLVSIYRNTASGAGYYTQSQLQALNVNAPLIARNPANGLFELTLGLSRSTNLSTFSPLPLTAPQVQVNQGNIRVFIWDTNNAAFYRLYAE